MEAEKIRITIKADLPYRNGFSDERVIEVFALRGALASKLDELCSDLEATFDH